MHQSVLADIQEARTSAAAPVVGLALGNVLLEAIQPGIAAFGQLARLLEHRLVHGGLFAWRHLPVTSHRPADPAVLADPPEVDGQEEHQDEWQEQHVEDVPP